jgi:hypothetical protein
VTGRFLVICGALLIVAANVALGDGVYQRTRDGKALVWNNYPKTGDEATWSGGRDRDGYARGFGALAWYATDQDDSGRPAFYARYWGNMNRGKFNGPVNVHSKRKTRHAIFVDGARSTRWAAGSAPSRMVRPEFVEAIQKEKVLVASKTETVPPGPAANTQRLTTEGRTGEPEAPAEGPLIQRSAIKDQRPEISGRRLVFREPGLELREYQSRGGQPQIDIDDSLRLLVWPPRSLGMTRGAFKGASPVPKARLTKEKVIELADAVARSHGYDLDAYERPEPQYDPADQTWSLFYNQKPIDESTGKHFNVAVGDKTGSTVLMADR